MKIYTIPFSNSNFSSIKNCINVPMEDFYIEIDYKSTEIKKLSPSIDNKYELYNKKNFDDIIINGEELKQQKLYYKQTYFSNNSLIVFPKAKIGKWSNDLYNKENIVLPPPLNVNTLKKI